MAPFRWGVYDLDDACSGAQHLATTGKVDGEKLCIDGGSAGGYTTLAALTFRNVFKAGKLLELPHGKTNNLHRRKQRRRSASR